MTSKRVASTEDAADPPASKRPKMTTPGTDAAPPAIDEDLHSRQLAVYGREAMRRMNASSVLVCGLRGLGVEVAKNVILAGIKSVTLWDTAPVAIGDLSAQFYLTKEDVGKNRAAACKDKLAELNTSVAVAASTAELTQDFLSKFQVVVYTEGAFEDAVKVNEACHAAGVAFIKCDCRGVFARVFCDFGEKFTVLDTDGEEPHSGIVASIVPGNPTLVTCIDDERLEFQDGNMVVFSEVEGMTGINSAAPIKVKNCRAHSFELELDSTGYEPYVRGGLVVQHKPPKELSFKTLQAAMTEPGEFLLSDFSKMERSPMLHLAFQALDAFVAKEGRWPKPGCAADGDAVVALYNAANAAAAGPNKADIDEDVVRTLASGSSGELSPMAAMFGGVVGQEVVKACSGKFHPLHQWFYFDSCESLPDKLLPEAEYAPEGSRYDGQVAVLGKTVQAKLHDMNVFLVGAGALGCEFLKNFAAMGLGADGKGKITVTDDDIIEKSNLSRQFLFRDWDIKKNKSSVAGDAAKAMNPGLHLEALQNRVAPNTEDVFNDGFWEGLDVVVNALDNVNARLYVDSRCVYFQKPLLESGTLGPKCNTQMVVPNMTENYGASRDPPEKQAPMCTVHSFPHNIDHCLTWARSEFEGMLEKGPTEANTFLADPQKYIDSVKASGDAGARESLDKVVTVLVRERPADFDACVAWAVRLFAEQFHHKISQLTHTFPEDATTSTGAPFWSAPKRFPKPVTFDPADASHVACVQAGAILKAEVHGIAVPAWAKEASALGKCAAGVEIPPFVPKEGVKIETDPKKTTATSIVADEDAVIADLSEQAMGAVAALPSGATLAPVEFEKDDDTNYHMALITGLANMRARSYSIPEVDALKAKLIAGRIIPAIATATALATGLVCLDLYKVLQAKPVEAYRNTFANLALPLFAQSEPIPPKTFKFKDMAWSLWDRWTIEGDLTVQELVTWFSDRSLEAYSVSAGSALLYNNIFPKHRERLGEKLSGLYTKISKLEIPSWRKHFDIVVACEDEEGEDVDVPLISIKFR